LLVASNYSSFLHRQPEAREIATCVSFAIRGSRDEEILAALVASAEYFAGV
jgi:hypothetical protein